MAEKKFIRTVGFYRLVEEQSLEGFPARDWQRVLETLHDNKARVFPINGHEVDGEVFDYDGELCLRVSNDRTTAPRQRNTTTRERRPMRVRGVDWEPTEECFVRFFEHDIFGMVSTNTSAPSHSAVARWLTRALNYQGSDRLKAVAMVDKTQYERLRQMGAVSVASVALRPKDAEPGGRGLLEHSWLAARNVGSGVRVEIKVTVEKGANNQRERQSLLAESEAILEALQSGQDLGVEKAVVRGKPASGGPIEQIDLIEATFTRRTEVELAGTAFDRSLTERSAIEAVSESYEVLYDKLLAAIAADLGDRG